MTNFRSDGKRLQELIHWLTKWDGMSTTVLPRLITEFSALMQWDRSFSYQLAETDKGFSVAFMTGTGFRVDKGAVLFDDFIRTRLTGWAGYNAIMPQANQRNRVLDWRQLCAVEPAVATAGLVHLYHRLDFHEADQVRALICDGSSLLAWFGGFRSEPLSRRETRMFEKLVPHLQKRLRFERILANSELFSDALSLVLESIPAAIFIISSTRAIHHTNAAGREMLTRDRRLTIQRIDAALSGAAPSGWSLLPIASQGLSQHYLIIASDPDRDDTLLKIAARRWSLSPAETAVLLHLVRGEANKTIAAELRRSIATVELHVSSILRKANVDNRAALVAHYWRLRFS